jgi:chromosome segregation ATPase
MAKKDAERHVAGAESKASALTRTALARQLAAANQDLNAVYEAEHQWRLDLLKANEEISRDTVDVEVEIRRLQQEELQLKAKLEDLEKQRDKLAAEDKDLTRQRDALQAECEQLDTQRVGLSDAVKNLTRETDAQGKEVAKLKADVDRLEALRKEYLAQIAKFKTQKAKLVEE